MSSERNPTFNDIVLQLPFPALGPNCLFLITRLGITLSFIAMQFSKSDK